MKTTSPSLFRRALAMLAVTITCGLSISPGQAGYIVTLQQVGSVVVATGSGAIDLTGLIKFNPTELIPEMYPSVAIILTGQGGNFVDFYGLGSISGPRNFGSGGPTFASSGTGDIVGMDGGAGAAVEVPQGYISGSALSDSATYSGQTFGTLGLNTGTYVWSWGIGADQNFTLKIGSGTVPDTGSTLGLFLVSLIALFGIGRFALSDSPN